MKDILGVALAVTILTMDAGTAEAATFRYEFDVTDVELGFFDFMRYPIENISGFWLPRYDLGERIPDDLAPGLIAEFHPLVALSGISGPNVWELNQDDGGGLYHEIRCISGPLCAYASPPSPPGHMPSDFGRVTSDGKVFGAFGIFHDLYLGHSDGLLRSTPTNGAGAGFERDGYSYLLAFPTTYITLSNVHVAEVPLPGGALLLASGVAALLWRRRAAWRAAAGGAAAVTLS